MEFNGLQVNSPVTIEVYNKGEIFLAHNPVVKRTKHIDTRYHFILQYIQNYIVKINFVQKKDNCADICTKNISEDTFDVHTKSMVTPCIIDENEIYGIKTREDVRKMDIGGGSYPINNDRKGLT